MAQIFEPNIEHSTEDFLLALDYPKIGDQLGADSLDIVRPVDSVNQLLGYNELFLYSELKAENLQQLCFDDDLVLGVWSLYLITDVGDQEPAWIDQIDGIEIFEDDHAIFPPQLDVFNAIFVPFGEKLAHFAPEVADFPVVGVPERIGDVLEQILVENVAQWLPFVGIPLDTSLALGFGIGGVFGFPCLRGELFLAWDVLDRLLVVAGDDEA